MCYSRRVSAGLRQAATVILLRAGDDDLEVFLLRRRKNATFMSGAFVFPGGIADDGEDDPRLTAARELFEEAGILLARTPGGAFVTYDGAEAARVDADRDAVHEGTRTLREVVERDGLRLALDAIVPFAHWITPPIEVRRFDTWFFAARAPEGQVPSHDAHESVESGWFAPQAAIEACRRGRINLPPPTWATLRQLEPFASVSAVLAWASRVAIPDRQPAVLHVNGAREIRLPSGHAHDGETGGAFETRFVWVDGRWLPGEP